MKILNKIIIGAIGIAMAGSFTSCDKELYKEEQYQQGAYLLSDENGIFGYEYELGGTTEGYLSVCAMGTTELDRDITVTLEPDDEILAAYNKKNFDQDKEKFAKELDATRYSIENMSATLKAGEKNPYAMLPIKVNPDGLSPDSTYFISLKIQSVSDLSFNKKKGNVLFRVYPKNAYAATKVTTNCTMTGTRIKGSNAAEPISATKVIKPLTKNGIRLGPDTQTNPGTVADIEKWCIVATVNEETITVMVNEEEVVYNTVTITPFKNVEVEAVTDKTSTYDPLTKSFHLIYKYNNNGTWYTIDEVIVRAS